MIMNDVTVLAFALLAGALLGALFFGGLWWTVRRGAVSRSPALWFIGSGLLRTGLTLAGFYFASAGQWQRLLLCLIGFAMARLVVMRLTRPSQANAAGVAGKVSHAP